MMNVSGHGNVIVESSEYEEPLRIVEVVFRSELRDFGSNKSENFE
jgi:hypothetical protein